MGKRTIYDFDPNNRWAEIQLHTGTVTNYHPNKKFGFVQTEATGQTGLFFHWNQGCYMEPYCVSKINFLPRFTRMLTGRVIETPKAGDTIVFLVGVDHQNRACVTAWAHEGEYLAAMKSCETRIQLDLEEYATNPDFRCMEEDYVDENLMTMFPRRAFEGKKVDFQSHPVPTNDTPDRFANSIKNGVRTERWFERKTVDGWIECEDPRTIRLQITPGKAREILAGCYRVVNISAGEVRWYSPDHTGRELIALGGSDRIQRVIKFKGTHEYEETVFPGNHREFESIWNLGKNVASEQAI